MVEYLVIRSNANTDRPGLLPTHFVTIPLHLAKRGKVQWDRLRSKRFLNKLGENTECLAIERLHVHKTSILCRGFIGGI